VASGPGAVSLAKKRETRKRYEVGDLYVVDFVMSAGGKTAPVRLVGIIRGEE
jgi:hypothetical protein